MARTTSRSRSTTPKRRSSAAPRGRRPLPLPVRLLVMALAFAAMVLFGAVLAGLTLQPSPASEALTHSNLRPGSSLELYWHHPSPRDAIKQIGGNVLLGVPFGILLPVLAPGAHGLLRVPALTAVMMLLVELVQGAVVTGRAFDIDDVILNTTGALLGYLLLGRRLGRAVHVPPGAAPAQPKAPRGGLAGRLRGIRRKGASAATK
ncbi:VanZ family protein [Streptomyces tailanensis]|uniref:VanZ family protein n=1 Tax=Streptomyces tailanensis TaxID=2569858 RepID=UPI00122E1D37|nr:VanZ family protein [Streptomyces tailanensis]